MLSKAGAASMNTGSMPRMLLSQGRGIDLKVSRRDTDRLLLIAAENNEAQQSVFMLGGGGDRATTSRQGQTGGGGGGSDMQTFRTATNDRQTWFDSLVQYPEIAAYNPTRVIDSGDEMLIINCVTKACRYKPGGHAKNDTCVFLLVDLMRLQFCQRCHSSNCKKHASYGAIVWHPIFGAGKAAIEEYLKTAWSLRTEVGPEITAAFGGIRG